MTTSKKEEEEHLGREQAFHFRGGFGLYVGGGRKANGTCHFFLALHCLIVVCVPPVDFLLQLSALWQLFRRRRCRRSTSTRAQALRFCGG